MVFWKALHIGRRNPCLCPKLQCQIEQAFRPTWWQSHPHLPYGDGSLLTGKRLDFWLFPDSESYWQDGSFRGCRSVETRHGDSRVQGLVPNGAPECSCNVAGMVRIVLFLEKQDTLKGCESIGDSITFSGPTVIRNGRNLSKKAGGGVVKNLPESGNRR